MSAVEFRANQDGLQRIAERVIGRERFYCLFVPDILEPTDIGKVENSGTFFAVCPTNYFGELLGHERLALQKVRWIPILIGLRSDEGLRRLMLE